jgi:hypothetical protein
MAEEEEMDNFFKKVSANSNIGVAVRLMRSGSVRKAAKLLTELAQDSDNEVRFEQKLVLFLSSCFFEKVKYDALYWLAEALSLQGDIAGARAAIMQCPKDASTAKFLAKLEEREGRDLRVGTVMAGGLVLLVAALGMFWFIRRAK